MLCFEILYWKRSFHPAKLDEAVELQHGNVLTEIHVSAVIKKNDVTVSTSLVYKSMPPLLIDLHQ